MNQLHGLLKLAWNRSRYDIGNVIFIYIGMWVFLLMCVVFLLLNLAFNVYPTFPVTSDLGAASQIGYIFLAGEFAVINTITTITFLTVVVCLFEYALAFTYICYVYDGRSWWIPNRINDSITDVCSWVDGWYKHQNEKAKEIQKRQAAILDAHISEIKMLE